MTLSVQAQRRGILAVLLGLAVLGWVLVAWQAAGMSDEAMTGDPMGGMAAEEGLDLTAGMTAPLFLAMWTAMMVAMMFPAAAPMVMMFARVQEGRRQQGRPAVATTLFVLPYLGIWVIFGALCYLAAVGFSQAVDLSSDAAARLAGVLLIGAGLYELTPLKRVCLRHCQTPLSFVMRHWQPGPRGAVRMALRHGMYCFGCCWALFLLMLPLGVMNIAAMVALAALVFAQKALPFPAKAVTAVAVGLVGYGVLALAVPDVLPTTV